MEAKKIKKIKAALHRYANETHNKLGPEKKKAEYLATFCKFLEKEKHAYEKDKIIEKIVEEPKKKKKKAGEETEDKKKVKRGKEEIKEDIEISKKKAKKGKDEAVEDLKANLDKDKKKKIDKSKSKKGNKENEEEEENEEDDLIPDITITDPNLSCVIEILAEQHMRKKHKKNAEKFEKHLEVPAFVINFGKKRGPIVKYWKNIKKFKYT